MSYRELLGQCRRLLKILDRLHSQLTRPELAAIQSLKVEVNALYEELWGESDRLVPDAHVLGGCQ
jgi:hypothetical protein